MSARGLLALALSGALLPLPRAAGAAPARTAPIPVLPSARVQAPEVVVPIRPLGAVVGLVPTAPTRLLLPVLAPSLAAREDAPPERHAVAAALVFDGLKPAPAAAATPVAGFESASAALPLPAYAPLPPTSGPVAFARRWAARAALMVVPSLFAGSCSAPEAPPEPRTWTHPQGTLSVEVKTQPFTLIVRDASGRVLAESAPARAGDDERDPKRAYAPLAVTRNKENSYPPIIEGWDSYLGSDEPWAQSTDVTGFTARGEALTAHVSAGGRSVSLRIEPQGPGARLVATVDGGTEGINRVSLAFRMHDAANGVPGDHFFGFGERFVNSDHRGKALHNWVEDGGFGMGEGVSPGVANPFPNGEGQTPVPIPWFLSPRGFGLLMNGTHRTVHHLGDEVGDAWRVESWRATADATLFADRDPMGLLAELTAVSGRPPEVADWVLAPRRRGDIGSDEADKLRAAKIPTTAIDTALHYFPNGSGEDAARMRATTADLHRRGFKAVAYFTSFVSDQWHPVFEDAAAKGYFVKRPDGRPYVVLDYPRHSAMVDFTNPEALSWYQGWLERALDDGWDGWMYDFSEYVPRDAVFHNGMSGAEAHNLYPVLYQRAAYEVMERRKPKDYLVFARSGFVGTGGLIPMLWAGDQNTDFSASDGLPAALTGGLNAGMSGLPFWSSDISGYHSLTTPPPDKEVYLRWTGVGGFSVGMHDENNGEAGPLYGHDDRWQIWKDQESQDVYRKFATVKTRMIPYLKLAVRQARERGTPVMRHLYLLHPEDPKVYGIKDQYMFGDSLLVAPVVTRGARSREVYLPEPRYFDFWSGERVEGGRTVTVPAPLDTVPVFARPGAIVPLLHPDIQTLFPSEDKSVVSLADRADFLEVAVFSGGQSSVRLDDGTLISQSAPLSSYKPDWPKTAAGALPRAASEDELMTCASCAWEDREKRLLKVAVVGKDASVSAGELSFGVSGAPAPKRFVFSVRY